MTDKFECTTRFVEQLAITLNIAAKDKSDADAIEERRKCLLSEMVNKIGGSIAKAEHEAKASEQYIEITEKMIEARTRANMSAATVKGMEVRFEAWRTAESSRRAEMQLR